MLERYPNDATERIAYSISEMAPLLEPNPHMMTGSLSSIVNSPLFEVLYNDNPNQQHFHNSKVMQIFYQLCAYDNLPQSV